MTLHVPYDHTCPQCEAWYIPYDETIPCPRCGVVEETRFDFIRNVVASAQINLAEQGRYHPDAWAITSFSDHMMRLVFLVLDADRQTDPTRPFPELAREAVEGFGWGEQEYGKKHLYEILLRVHADLEKRKIAREQSWIGKLVRWIRGLRSRADT